MTEAKTNPQDDNPTRLAVVFTVGEGGAFDVYATEDAAISAVMDLIQDDFYSSRLSDNQRNILRKIMDEPRLAIDYYNSVAREGVRWLIRSHEVRTSKPKRRK